MPKAKDDPFAVRKGKEQLVSKVTEALITKDNKAQSTKGIRKLRRVCYLRPDQAKWLQDEAHRRSRPGKRFPETQLFEEAIDLLIKEANQRKGGE